MRAVDLEESLFLGLVVHNRVLLDHLNLEYSITCMHLPVEVNPESLDIVAGDCHILLDHVDIEVGREIVDVRTH